MTTDTGTVKRLWALGFKTSDVTHVVVSHAHSTTQVGCTNAKVTDDEILAHCARYLDFARRSKVVIRGDDIPYTVTGKAKRLELKKRLAPALEKYREHEFRRSMSGSLGSHEGAPGTQSQEELICKTPNRED